MCKAEVAGTEEDQWWRTEEDQWWDDKQLRVLLHSENYSKIKFYLMCTGQSLGNEAVTKHCSLDKDLSMVHKGKDIVMRCC